MVLSYETADITFYSLDFLSGAADLRTLHCPRPIGHRLSRHKNCSGRIRDTEHRYQPLRPHRICSLVASVPMSAIGLFDVLQLIEAWLRHSKRITQFWQCHNNRNPTCPSSHLAVSSPPRSTSQTVSESQSRRTSHTKYVFFNQSSTTK
jgi:hypothetical protein